MTPTTCHVCVLLAARHAVRAHALVSVCVPGYRARSSVYRDYTRCVKNRFLFLENPHLEITHVWA